MITEFTFNNWVDMLRSGIYVQGFGKLKTDDGCFCCLGVLKEELKRQKKAWRNSERGLGEKDPYNYVLAESALPIDLQDALTAMNDIDRMSFYEIADFLEMNKEAILKGEGDIELE